MANLNVGAKCNSPLLVLPPSHGPAPFPACPLFSPETHKNDHFFPMQPIDWCFVISYILANASFSFLVVNKIFSLPCPK
jgi:hypothetical protein